MLKAFDPFAFSVFAPAAGYGLLRGGRRGTRILHEYHIVDEGSDQRHVFGLFVLWRVGGNELFGVFLDERGVVVAANKIVDLHDRMQIGDVVFDSGDFVFV